MNYKTAVGRVLLCSFLLLALASCRISGFFSGYKSLTKEEKRYVIDYSLVSDIEGASRGFIYQISPENLIAAMDKHEYNLIYTWAPFCSSELCITPNIAVAEAQKRGYKPWIIVEYYDKEIIGQKFDVPIYAVKNSIYYTDYCQKYIRLFLSDLGHKEVGDNLGGRFYLFKGSKFVAQKDRISDF